MRPLRVMFIPILLVCAASMTLLACRGSGKDPRLAPAREALERGETQHALEMLTLHLRENPNSAEAMDLKGLALQASGSPLAEEAFHDAIRLAPKNAEARDHLAAWYYQSGHTQRAAQEWQEAIRADPSYVPAHYNLGSLYQSQGRLDEAAAQFREALRLKPDLMQARMNLGIALVSLGRFPEAEKELREAAKLNPKDAEAAFNLGAALVSARKGEEGIRELQRALSLRPDFAEAHEQIATAYFYDGRIDAADKEFREAIRLKKDSPGAHVGLGVLLTEQGKEADAIREYEEALAIQPLDRTASINLALLYGKAGAPPARGANRIAAFEVYRRALLAGNWAAAWSVLSARSQAMYLDDLERFRYAAQKAFSDPKTRERLSAASFFLPYLEPPQPDPSSGLPYDPGRMGAVRERDGEWKVDLLVLSGLPSPDPQR